jgi:hypothetical protein
MKSKLVILFAVLYFNVNAQINVNQKEYNTSKINDLPKIDGILDDAVWNTLPETGDFVMLNPEDGTPELETHKTKVKIGYTDDAIYVAAYMYDNEPDKILRQFSQRDDFNKQADYFIVSINTYNNAINETKFLVTSAGTIADGVTENGRNDWSWNTVFKAEISYDEKGWYAEFKIPFAALRFPEKEEQIWSLQLYRQIKHLNLNYTWNYIDRSVGNESQYNGLLKGINNIKPPTRLSFYPFTSVNQEHFENSNETTFNAGMDIKYGINDSFTLDATLIPDFGQTKFDDVVLNLGPFEQVFSENRAFFTEGTELFNKGDLFYSRRVGNRPSEFYSADDNLNESEEVTENPDNVKLLNALKLSGRTKKGLGIGFFNSITQKTKATITDNVSGSKREFITEPTANYNVFVLDQQLKNSSSISLVNTNVMRNASFRDANVTGALFDINNKNRSFNYSGKMVMSYVSDLEDEKAGFSSRFGITRTKGNFRYDITNFIATDNYNINDLGINRRINYNNTRLRLSYENFTPTKKLNKYKYEVTLNHDRRLNPDDFVRNKAELNFYAVTVERFAFGGETNYQSESKDFYEPREDNRYLSRPGYTSNNAWISSDFRKKFALDVDVRYTDWKGTKERNFSWKLVPRYRFTDKLSLVYNFNNSLQYDKIGYIDNVDDTIIMGKRDIITLENAIETSYNFNSKQALNLSFRNFWSRAKYGNNAFSKLNNNGSLTPTDYNTEENNPNRNFNIWNLDLTFNWRFAPGSEAILLYRQQIFNEDGFSEADFNTSYETLFDQPLKQLISLRIVYFLDYNQISKKLKG